MSLVKTTEMGKKSFMFCVHCDHTIWGESVAVVGTFCAWDPAGALRMHTTEQIWPIWMSEPITLNPGRVEYKYIIVGPAEDEETDLIRENGKTDKTDKVTWEKRSNRQLLASAGQANPLMGLLNLALAMTPRIGSAAESRSETCMIMDERFGHVAAGRPVEDVLPTARRRFPQPNQSPSHANVAIEPNQDADAAAGTLSSRGAPGDGGKLSQKSPPLGLGDLQLQSASGDDSWTSTPLSARVWQQSTPRSWRGPAPMPMRGPAQTRCMIPRISLPGATDTSQALRRVSDVSAISAVSDTSSDSQGYSSCSDSDVDSNEIKDGLSTSKELESPFTCPAQHLMDLPPPRWMKWNRAAWDYPLSKKDMQDRLLMCFEREQELAHEQEEQATSRMNDLEYSCNELRDENQWLRAQITSRETAAKSPMEFDATSAIATMAQAVNPKLSP